LTGHEKRGFVVVGLMFGAVAFLPLLDSGVWLSLGVDLAMYTVLATAWTLFSDPTHYISLATAAFFGLGMYVVGGGVELLPFPVLVLLAAIGGVAVSAIIGLATLRISGVYFVIFTLGLAELIRQIVAWVQTTMGRSSGLYVLTNITKPMIYWQLLALAALVYLIGWWIGRSRLGFALRIIGNDEVVAVHSGIDTARAKVLLFIISGTIASIIGAILAPRWTYIEPTIAFSPMISFLVVIMALLGGAHRLWGPLVGVIPFYMLWGLISAHFPNQTMLVMGVAFLLIVYLIPNGVVGLIEKSTHRLKRGDG
jgi:branched-chain amino acid transport system permease protein